ncbi:hypothetical protein HPP92_019954 [Vanilla planifolia]|uniref:NF-X1-type domain-containing protein n=1 Tax=Vanilla planifolia TaxID=51239 RepID=A0A835UM97_VANPL|nr:hypothetical protein HPP92_019954 [Vanilla planifolia]
MAVKGDFDDKSGIFSCNSVCNRSLSCGNHLCGKVCHPGPCGECELLPGKINTCHCGKMRFVEERKTCLDPIPTCSEVCGKPLVCNIHFCKIPCHDGSCPPCSVRVEQRCRCGSSCRSVQCYQLFEEKFQFICEKTCGRKKNCGRHRCNERCCPLSKSGVDQLSSDGDWDPHLCSVPCGKRLRCGNHSCQLLCHSGYCPPCLETIFTDLSCACGKTLIPPPIPCGTPMPSCPHPCIVSQPCGHAASHSCHFGDCPPCTVPVIKECIGGHVMLRNIPCGSKDIRCNQLCGKTRQCGIHACARTCHPPPCDSSPVSASGGRITATVPCGAGASSSSFNQDNLLEASVIQKLQVSLQPVEGNGRKVPIGLRKLTCDEECEKAARKRQLAEAFDVPLPNLDALHFGENSTASESLSDLLRRDPKWVIAIEERFKFMVLGKSKAGTGSSLKDHKFESLLNGNNPFRVSPQEIRKGF